MSIDSVAYDACGREGAEVNEAWRSEQRSLSRSNDVSAVVGDGFDERTCKIGLFVEDNRLQQMTRDIVVDLLYCCYCYRYRYNGWPRVDCNDDETS